MPDVLMPRLSDSMEEGTLLRWLVEDGADVARGDEICEIETDKATMSYEADEAGVLRHVAAEGDTLEVGAVIATIGGSASAAPADAAPPVAEAVASPPAAPPPPAEGAPARGAPANGRAAGAAPGVSASPVARRLADALGVELAVVHGTGPRGRILKADVRAAAESPAQDAPEAAPVPSPAPTGAKGGVTTVELTRTQQTIARRMAEAKATAPDFQVSVDVDMGEALALRARLKEQTDAAPSVNDLLVKAVAQTLRLHPRVNGAYRDGRFELFDRVNIGIAVAAEDALVVPTIPDADRLGLGAIARLSRELAGKVRAGTITPPELSGGTFTISNLGMFGVDRFEGVLNAGQAAILCAGAIVRRPVVAPDGGLVAGDVMTLTLVSDHRILYGADAARFMADLRATLERPLRMLL